MMLLPYLTQLYDAYVDTYREADGSLPVMMQLKRTHTAFVVKNAELIADGEGLTPEEREVALAAALLHDTGRYEQLRRFNTFRDSDSVDHAVFSHDIVKSLGWLVILDKAVEKREDVRRGGTRRDEPAVFIGREPRLHRIRRARSAPQLVEKISPENALKAA